MNQVTEAQMEMSAKFIQQALGFCTTQVFKGKHGATAMNDSERLQMKNCFKKYVSAPNILGPVLQANTF